jgi:hypothetical protein
MREQFVQLVPDMSRATFLSEVVLFQIQRETKIRVPYPTGAILPAKATDGNRMRPQHQLGQVMMFMPMLHESPFATIRM